MINCTVINEILKNICSVLNTIELKVNWQNVQIILAKYTFFIGKIYRLCWQNVQIILAKCIMLVDYTYFDWQNTQIFIVKIHRLYWQVIEYYLAFMLFLLFTGSFSPKWL